MELKVLVEPNADEIDLSCCAYGDLEYSLDPFEEDILIEKMLVEPRKD